MCFSDAAKVAAIPEEAYEVAAKSEPPEVAAALKPTAIETDGDGKRFEGLLQPNPGGEPRAAPGRDIPGKLRHEVWFQSGSQLRPGAGEPLRRPLEH